MKVAEPRGVKELEAESGRLKQIYANLSLQNDALKELIIRKL